MRIPHAFAPFISLLFLVGCGSSGGGGGSGGSTPPVTPPPPAGLITFANGASFNVNDDATTGRKFSQDTNTTVWQFYTTAGYTLMGYGAKGGLNLVFSFAMDNTTLGGAYCTKMLMDFGGGHVETRYLATDTSGNIRLMGVQGAGPEDFIVTSLADSPKIFLNASIAVNAAWVGGFSGNDSMTILEVDVPSPSGPTTELHSIHIKQISPSSIATDWWIIKNQGFMNTQRTTDGYDRLWGGTTVPSGYTRIPSAAN